MSMPSSSELVATMARSCPGFERGLDALALLARDAAVVSADHGARAELVELAAQPLAQAARVHEDDGALVLATSSLSCR